MMREGGDLSRYAGKAVEIKVLPWKIILVRNGWKRKTERRETAGSRKRVDH
jgi:hypothetical protein